MTCLQCKTSDLALKWKHLGDKDPRTKWDRTSDVNKLITDGQNPVGCIQCHEYYMPKEKNASGATFSSQQVVRPKDHVKKSCLGVDF